MTKCAECGRKFDRGVTRRVYCGTACRQRVADRKRMKTPERREQVRQAVKRWVDKRRLKEGAKQDGQVEPK